MYKRLFMRKPSIEYVDQFYNILLKKEPVGKWLAKSRGMSKEEANDYIRESYITLGTV